MFFYKPNPSSDTIWQSLPISAPVNRNFNESPAALKSTKLSQAQSRKRPELLANWKLANEAAKLEFVSRTAFPCQPSKASLF
jgi:hypothetical protein